MMIGFVGLGNLGLPVVKALLRAGHEVAAYDVRAEAAQAAASAGARAASSLDDLAGCDTLALAVPDDAAVDSVIEAVADSLAPHALVVVHSTILPDTARRLGIRLTERKFRFLDAPVSGGADRAERGTLTVMAGGNPAVLESARTYLDAIAETVVHVGPAGAGAAAKLANQLMMFAALAGAHEALALARAYDVPEEKVLQVTRTSTGDSWVARTWGFFDQVAADYDAASVPVRNRPWSKDLWDVVAAARAADLALPVAGLLAQTLAETVERHAHEGNAH